MLHLITGRAGSGKTEYVRNLLEQKALTGDTRLLLLVPEQFSFASERALLERLGEQKGQSVEVLSFTRLCNYVFRELGGLSGNIAEEAAGIILMLRAMDSVKEHLRFYEKHAENVSLAKELLTTVKEMERARISPSDLEEAAVSCTGRSAFSMKVKETALIYGAFRALLSQSFLSQEAQTERLLDLLKGSHFFEGYTIAADGFKGFTGQEFALLKELMSQAEDVFVSLCTEDIYGTDPSLAFLAVNDTARRLIAEAKQAGVPVEIIGAPETESGRRFQNNALSFLEQNLFRPTDKTYPEFTENVQLYAAQTLYDECNYIAATTKKLMREQGYRLTDIAVIVRNEESYRRELTAAFQKYEIPVFEDKRQPVFNQPLMVLIRSLLSLLTDGFRTEHLLRYLKTGLSPLDDLEIARLENYAYLWNLKAADWKKEFTGHPSGLDAPVTEESRTELEELNEMRTRIMTPLLKLRKKCKDANAEQISKSLYEFLLSTNVKDSLKAYALFCNEQGMQSLASEQNRIWELLMELFNTLSTVSGSGSMSAEQYTKLFHAVLSVTDLGKLPQAMEVIPVGAADRIRLENPKVVFVAGCAEGVFPAIPSPSGIFTKTDRALLTELHLELSLPDRLQASDERFIAYSSVTAASEKVYLSYHKIGSAPGDSLTPSILFESASALFENRCPNLSDADLSPAYFAETKDSALFSYAESSSSTQPSVKEESASVRTALEEEENSLINAKLEAIDGAKQQRTFAIKDPKIATELFGKNMYLSASKADVYHKCAFEYFCKFGMKAKPMERAELDPAKSGTVIHYVLEQIIKENGMDKLIQMSASDRADQIGKWLKTFAEERMGGFEDKNERFRYLYRRLRITLIDVVNRLCEEFENSLYEPTDFELSIGKGKEIEAYHLDLPDGGALDIQGSVDRVDTYETEDENGEKVTYIRVVDYKSGGKDFKLSDCLYGLNMQMLIYLFAIEANGAPRYGKTLPAGIFYYPAKRNTSTLPHRNMSQEELQTAKWKNDMGNGMFLWDQKSLEAMEKNLAGHYIPVKTNKSGELKGNLISLHHLGLLRKRIDAILTEMGESLHNGNIAALPAEGTNYKNTCKYCDYKAVCRREGDAVREIVSATTEEACKLLEGGDENGQPVD